MKKVSVFLIVVVVICAIFSGCGEKNQQTSGGNQMIGEANSAELASYLVEHIKFKDYMNPVDKDIFLSLFNLEADAVEDASLYSSTGATAEEVAVIKATKGNTEKVQEACKERIQAQKEGFENYVPEELEKLDNPTILTVGNTVVFVVCNDSESADKILANYENTEI